MSEVVVGTMNFGGRTPVAEALKIVDRALERGVTRFDTANMYEGGESERILARAIRGRRDRVHVATKVGLLRRKGKPEGLAASRIREALAESLERLGTDYVDLYYLHAPDPNASVEEILDGLQPLIEARQVRAWGVSNFASWQLLELQLAAQKRGMPGPEWSQVLYNLLVRQLEVEYFAFTRAHPVRTVVYNPLAGGLLARTPKAGSAIPPGSRFERNPLYRKRYWTDAMAALTEQYAELAREAGLELVTLAYAWLAGRPGVDAILAGPGTVEHLDAAIDACAVTLPPELRERIEAIHRAFTGTDASYAR